MKIIAFVNQKGGVGKTTSVLNCAAALEKLGKRVLAVDLDAQGNLTSSLGVESESMEQPTICEVLTGRAEITDAVVRLGDDRPDLLMADIRLSGTELELMNAPGRDLILKEALRPIQDDYDFCLIDCSPSLNILNIMALTATDAFICPVSTQYMPLIGIVQLENTIDIVKKRLNHGLHLCGVLVTFYDSRRSLDKTVLETIQKRFGERVFPDIIKYNSKIAESPARSMSVLAYAPGSLCAVAYENIAKEIIRREEDEYAV